MKKNKWLLIISLTLNIAMGGYLLFQLYKFYEMHRQFRNNYGGIYYNMRRNELFKLFPNDSEEIIFLGDSHMEYFGATEFYNNIFIKNRGISGDNTSGILNRLDEVVESKPAKVFIEIGIKDVMKEVEQDTILHNYCSIIQYLKYKSPNTKIYVLSIFPNGWFVKGGEVKVLTVVNEINKKLAEICREEDVEYINLTAALMLGSHINPGYYMPDSVHLSPQGYLMLKNRLEPYVNN